MHDFQSSTVPGCRAPHLWLKDGRSLYDALGPDYTLLRFDPSVHIEGFVRTAKERTFPLTVFDVEARDACPAYTNALLLVRPDQHVAWRGDQEPSIPEALINVLSGAGDPTTVG